MTSIKIPNLRRNLVRGYERTSHQVKQYNVKIIIGFIHAWTITHSVFFFFFVTSPAGFLMFNYSHACMCACNCVHMCVCLCVVCTQNDAHMEVEDSS